jgi:putative methylase
MKKKELEIMLQKVPLFENPVPHLEQYITPAGIVADILFIASQFNDIQDKIVVDLGCGTGIFSFGASFVNAKEVIGIDIDENSIKTAKTYAKEIDQDIKFLKQDINDVDVKCDTVIMNPPFGAQKSSLRADRKFIEKAFDIAKVVYSLHLSETIPFIEKMILSLNGEITFYKDYVFPIRHTFDFHSKDLVSYNVTLIRILTKR